MIPLRFIFNCKTLFIVNVVVLWKTSAGEAVGILGDKKLGRVKGKTSLSNKWLSPVYHQADH